ncbi:M14 family metallopeptidase [Pontimicrobium aquaticum]|nr:M14 family metallopeptidase [Pontimicrobium aquaticum]
MFKTNQSLFKLFWICMCLVSVNVFAQSDYRNNNELTNALKQLKSKHSANVKLQSLTKTIGGHDIWALTLFKGKPEDNPAIAIVGGVDGSLLLSREMAVNIAENILTNHKDVLDNTTFYIFPNMSPNASEQYFSKLKYHKLGNAKKTDDDRDGLTNEDTFEDLNNDGLITLIRVEDVTGNYIKLKEDERVMIKANPQEGELGTHKVFSEGIDNDKDGKYNEDGDGGVHFNKNLTYNFPYFQPGAGEHAVSEKEHRALLDFLYEQWNIYAILTLGPENNLSNPLKYNAANARKRVVASILKDDEALNKFLSKKYTKITGTKDAPNANGKGGDFFEWSYFHFGKLAMSTPGWWAPKFKGDSTIKAKKNYKANFLQWAEAEDLSNYFVDWKEVNHPDFPNKKVEVGGIAPFVMTNPPYSMVEDISKKHTDFVLEISKMQPNISIENVTTEKVDNGLTRVTLNIHNKGLLPTHTEMGKRSRWLRRIKVDVKLDKSQEVISGKKIQLINSIDGDSSEELTWLIKGKGSLTIEAGAAHTGADKTTINLK